MNQVPPYLTPGRIAAACNLTTREVRDDLAGVGLLEPRMPTKRGRGVRYHVSSARLLAVRRDYYDRVIAAILDEEESDDGDDEEE